MTTTGTYEVVRIEDGEEELIATGTRAAMEAEKRSLEEDLAGEVEDGEYPAGACEYRVVRAG